MDERKKRFNVHGIIGAGVLAVAQFLMLKRVEPFTTGFYFFAWWSYILIVDSLIYHLKGNSLILNRTREFFLMIPWSFTLWLFFEMVNVILKDWYYINVPNDPVGQWLGYAAAYGTVLPGIFETTELLETLGLFERTSAQKIKVTPLWYRCFFVTGGLFLILPLAFPRYAFPLIWGSFVFLLEPVNHRSGGKSLLRDWEKGSLRKFYVLLAAGLICGFLWEFWNFWSRTKWIYTVPFFDRLKLFEMPMLGFLGFPPFAVECYVIYNFISLFRYKRGWEQDTSWFHAEKKTSRALRLAVVVSILVFYIFSTRAVEKYTVASYLPLLEDFPSVTEEQRQQLEGMGIHTTDDLLETTKTGGGYDRILKVLDLSPDRLDDWIRQARLIDLEGLGIENSLLLQSLRIDSVEKLARQNPDELYKEVVKTRESNPCQRHPSRAQIGVWVRAARKSQRL